MEQSNREVENYGSLEEGRRGRKRTPPWGHQEVLQEQTGHLIWALKVESEFPQKERRVYRYMQRS